MKISLLIPVLAAAAFAASARAEMSRDDAAAMAQRSAGGRVLSIGQPDGASGEWRVKMLSPQGVVRVIGVDPATGRIAGPNAAQTPERVRGSADVSPHAFMKPYRARSGTVH